MKQSKKKLIRKLKREEINLNESIKKCEAFMKTEDFKSIDFKQRVLLQGQHSTMLLYQRYLLDRINDLELNHDTNKEN